MTLTNRVTVFALAAMAIVLIGSSTAVVWLARGDLHRRANQRLDSALDVLQSTVEVKPTGLQWESSRQLAFTGGPNAIEISWAVVADDGEMVANSEDEHLPEFLPFVTGTEHHPEEPVECQSADGRSWLVKRRLMTTPDSPGDDPRRLRREYVGRNASRKKNEMMITTGCCLNAINAELWRLTALLFGVSGAAWALSALLARAFCRRALGPVRRMARATRDLSPRDLSARLPVPASGDELTDLANSFNELLDRVQETFERQRRFSAEASHQLRTPLAGILSQAEVALRRPRSEEEYRHTLRLVRDRTDDLRKMVETLMFLARAESDAQAPALEPVELGEWLRGFAAKWEEDERHPDIRPELPAGPVWVNVQPVFLAELLDNLVDNALKYGTPGSPVRIAVERYHERIVCTVIDRGPGIPADELPRLFDPFYRSRDARLRGQPGVGLGLTVARRLAEALGATLEVTSEPGEGSRFTVGLATAPAGLIVKSI
ncbi:HAMP domain-containing sensor histidine kinase [Zavarzinella formosa]|uniref:HAMP domain-containing sensor histidine kinase n=1 Tax=Zavarzinella formosa TaxID=360055 RepID=UPI0002F98032|nr:ATP-binding protein [Zavarzinella formosa]